MRRRPLYFSLLSFFFLLSCAPSSLSPSTPVQSVPVLYVFRLEPPALVELSPDDKPLREIPFFAPGGCALNNIYPSPRSAYLAVELSCAFGQTVVWANTDTDEVKQAFTESDSHFLAWASDGQAVYLRVDSAANPRIVRVYTNGKQASIPITELTYDLSPAPDNLDFTFTFSRGMSLGSEMWLAQKDGNIVKQIAADKNNYLSFARWSPDGKQIAFIKIPDSPIPFTVGQLWIVNADGSNGRKLAEADAGHGYAASWSPDGKSIAFVARENPQDTNADQNAGALISNIYLVDVASGKLTQLTRFEKARVEAPFWSADGNTIVFTVVLNDKINVYRAEVKSGETKLIITESACCPAWMRK
ncbi:MAG: PD40 domain-containing protein [Chloroflexi bacterium]|nr:PD40 domain-containing protein [Chloroflexota bacterium]MBI3338967.1 PD40 domain-containing protein [Chloroflexota bacterium]